MCHKTLFSVILNIPVEWVAFLLCIHMVLDLDLSLETDFSDQVFLSSVPPGNAGIVALIVV